jgi:hypothetical protein
MRKHNLLVRVVIISALVLVVTAGASGQKPVKCPSKSKTKTMYRMGISDRTAKGPPTLIMQISVQPKKFNREDITTLAQQLKEDFCQEQRIHISLFDDAKEAKSTALIYGYLSQGGETGALRGFYDLDRTTGKEVITFATKRNNPLNEVVIDLRLTNQ